MKKKKFEVGVMEQERGRGKRDRRKRNVVGRKVCECGVVMKKWGRGEERKEEREA